MNRFFTDKEILDRVRSLPSFNPVVGFPTGILEVGVRSKADLFDQFDDKFFTYDCSDRNNPVFLMARKGTTNSGSYGLKKFHEYNHLGCAVLKSDQIVYDSHVFGKFRNKDAYRQNKGFPYYRDNNRNNRAEEIGPVYNDIIGAHLHRAGVDSTVINNWSTACMVTAKEADFKKWLKYLADRGNPPVSLCILKEF